MSGLTFLSWVREGLGASGSGTDPLTGSLPARGTVTVKVRINDRPEVEVPTRLYGPGDVAGIDPRQVLRTDPPAGTDGFEPHLFAQVEFDRPDLPWMFSPAAPTGEQRLRPWLVLVVVEADRATVVPDPKGGLPRLVCAPEDLPDLSESWAWAHAQVVTDGDLNDATVDGLLAEAPERTLSRLVCPKRLDPHVAYVAAVVPAFEAGRLAGIGEPVEGPDATELRPAWPPVSAQADWALPAYHHWTFVTGERGDFESLVGRLVPRALPGKIGVRELDAGSAGSGLPELPAGDPHRVVDFEGPLRSVGTRPRTWDENTRRAFESAYDRLLPTAADRLSPPTYGDQMAGRSGVPGDGQPPRWLRDLNVDPRHRAAAALGAEVVRRHQEDLVSAAWDQAAEIRQANEALRQGQLARELSDSIYRRRLGVTANPADGLDDPHLLQVAAPARHDVEVGDATVGDELTGNREAEAAVSPAFRRLSRPGGPVDRRTPAESGDLGTTALQALASRDVTATPALRTPPGLLGFEDFSDGETFDHLRGERLTPRWWEQDPQLPRDEPGEYSPPLTQVGAPMGGRVFVVTVDGRLMSRVENDVHVGWVDHGRPPDATINSDPVGVRDLHTFVTGGNGALYECGWDGERWHWISHGTPPGTTIGWGFGPATSAWDSRPVSGGLAQTGTFDSVWCVGTNGVLYERKAAGGGWVWVTHGTPPGTLCQSTPSVLSWWRLALRDSEGRLQEYRNSGNGWVWTSHGKPSTYVWVTGRIAEFGAYLAAMATDGKLYLTMRVILMGDMWIAQSPPQTPGVLLGRAPDGSLLVKSTAQTIMAWSPSGGWQTPSGPPPTDPAWGLRAVVAGADVYGVGQSRLVRLLRGGAPTWQDLGQPVFGGRGNPDVSPFSHIRWRPRLGFMSNLVVGHVDNPGGVNAAYVRFGRDVGFDGEVRGGWEMKPTLPHRVGDPTQGFALAVADLDGNSGRPDLLQFWIEEIPGYGNFGKWRIGRNLDAAGNPASWTDERRMPTPMSTFYAPSGALSISYRVENGTATLADLDGDGRQELVVVYVSGAPADRRLYLRIGWRINPDSGAAEGGWSESVEVPWETRTAATAPPVVGMGVSVDDLNGDLRPELTVLLLEQVGGAVRASYRIGWQLNARGKVTGGWSPIKQIPGSFGASVAGAGIAVADVSGSAQPDLVVFHLENPEMENRAYYRIGWDCNAAGDPARWGPATRIQADGWFGWENQGASIAVADLDNALLGQKRQMATRFRSATLANLTAVHRSQEVAAADDEQALALGRIAGDVRQALLPDVTVTARVTSRLTGVDLADAELTDPLGQLLAPPRFGQPMSELLAELGQEHLLPGAGNVPLDTVTLLRANPAFVEAFLVGANHELGRELLWREFPTDRRATAFREFWDSRGADGTTGDTADIPPVAQWPGSAHLGQVATTGAGNGAVLLVRGEVVRRFPSLGLHARRALPPAVPGGSARLGSERQEPAFQGMLEPDILFVGFPFTVEQARGGAGDPGWFFVFEEQPSAPRFGMDVPPDKDPGYGTAPATWRDLSWAAVVDDQQALDHLGHVPVLHAPFGTPERPLASDSEAPPVTWGHNSAHMAHIHLQQPVRVAYHATALLPPGVGDGWRITHVRTRTAGDPQTRIRAVAGRYPDGTWWQASVDEVLAAIARRERFYVEEPTGDPVDVVVSHTHLGRSYLRTRADGDAPNNLLSLPPIPADIS
ncbi:DUF3892 domain-containing protein [Actinopolymorpha singaporensis]|uniref:Repeat domain-containing protein n=1 Tax=Actinopolymorpha singaporensis TaxID=117157 RepID=A0A1H1UMH6_9ACTN|nr:DUF3892 domain-containing protein [Actinopolymorpha singaporensis]SDS73717.1 Protein of unknown function [Actinopolymorpha singaporensis]